MMKYMEYLTDTELDCLIQEIEQNELVSMPRDLQEQIMEAVNQEMLALEEQKARDLV